MTGADGRVKEGPFDTPIALEPGAKAVVQGYGIHRARNAGDEEAEVWSLRVLAADKPAFALIGLREFAKTFVNLDGGNNATVLNVVPRYGPYDDRQKEFVNDIRELIIPSFAGLGDHEAYVGGSTAQFMDFSDKLYDRFPFLVAAVLLLTFIVLMMFFQSVFLPLKAILMNLASILATYGVLVLIFQHGWGADLFRFEPVGAIAVVTPAILFVILFSLSTDYEVFMLSRIKEYYNATHDNEESVAKGLQHTAGVITAAGPDPDRRLRLVRDGRDHHDQGDRPGARDRRPDRHGAHPHDHGPGDDAAGRLDANWWMPDWLKRIVPELREGPVGEIGLAPEKMPD